MVVSNGTLNQSISLGKPTNIAKYDEIVGLKDKFIKQEGKEIWIRLICATKCVIILSRMAL